MRGDIELNKICCFAGHSKLADTETIYERLYSTIEHLISTENVNEFLVGNYGDFDRLSARAVRALKEKYSNIQLNLVVPYLTSEINENKELYYKNYDNILITDMPENTPMKVQILKANQYIVSKSQFLVCYIKYSFGGASKTLEYAKKKTNVKIINIEPY